MRVIIVEDEILIREGLRKLLNKIKKDYEIIGEAVNGREGYDMIISMHPDLVITDIRMPLMDGLEMLGKAKQDDDNFKVIVLSAYSEFDYAKKAISIGVSEYLLKPIVLNDLTRSLENIETQLYIEEESKGITGMTLEMIFRGVMFGTMILDQQLKGYLLRKYDLDASKDLGELILSIEDNYEKEQERTLRYLHHFIKEKIEAKVCLMDNPRDKTIVLLFWGEYPMKKIERICQYSLFGSGKNIWPADMTGGWAVMSCLDQLRLIHGKLLQSLDWTLTLGEEVMITYPRVLQIKTSPCLYPLNIEKKIKIAICSRDLPEIWKLLMDFQAYFSQDKLYDPKEVKDLYVRFLWSIMTIAKEVYSWDEDILSGEVLLQKLLKVRSKNQMTKVLKDFYEDIFTNQENDQAMIGLTVMRAKQLIHEYYKNGITLEEIAEKLQVTPEYLGTLFHQEMGIHFSHYIRDFRINKAKGLLLSTELRLYEVSERVGYADAKYFSRVFKEVTGWLPSDYRKVYK